MSNVPDNAFLRRSQRLYACLLVAYPKRHREEYGPAMQQVFRDQCRDAWRDARGWGLTMVWLRVLPDLVKTSVLEHLATLSERKSMLERMIAMLRLRSGPSSVFWSVFTVVFLLVVAVVTAVTFLLPDNYVGTARIKVERDFSDKAVPGGQAPLNYDPYFIQTEFEVIQSQAVLGRVVKVLDLTSEWGKKYAAGAKLKESEALQLLKGRLDLRPVRNTSLIEIRVFSESPEEAAQIANAVAEEYRDYRLEQHRQSARTQTQTPQSTLVEIVDRAIPGRRPARPNRPRDVVFGMLGGFFLASAAGTLAARIVVLIRRKTRGRGPDSGASQLLGSQ